MKRRGGRTGGVFLLVLLGCCGSTDPGRRGECGRAERRSERAEAPGAPLGLTEVRTRGGSAGTL